MTSSSSSKPLQSVLSKVDEASQGHDTDLKSVLEAFGDRAFGPILTLCGIILLTPVGAIPGLPLAIFVVLSSFALQIILGRNHPWVPKSLSRIRLKQAQLTKTKKILRPWLARIDSVLTPRWSWATQIHIRRGAAFMTLLLAASVLLLGAVPFGAMLPGVVIALLGLGITARDGLFIAAGLSLGAFFITILLSIIF